MARIREYSNTQGIDVSPLTTAGRETQQAAYYTGQEIASGARALASGYDKVLEHVGDNEVSAYAKKASDLDIQLTKDYADAQANADPNDHDFAQNFMEQHVQPALDKFADENTPFTDKGRDYLEKVQLDLHSSFFKKALSDQVNTTAATRVSNANDAARNYAVSSEMNPENTDSNADMIRSVVGPLLPAAQRAEGISNAITRNYEAGANAVLSRLEAKPDTTVAQLETARTILMGETSNYRKYATPAMIDNWTDRITKAEALRGSIQSQLLEQQLPLLFDQIKAGGHPEAQAQASSIIDSIQEKTPEETAVAKSKFGRDLITSVQYGSDAQAVRELPDTAIDALRTKTQDDFKNANTDEERLRVSARLEAIDAGQTARNKEFLQDPALYATAHNNTVGAAAQAFEKNPNPATWALYASKSEAYQRQIKPGRVPQFATQQMKQSIATALQGITTDPQGAARAGAVLDQWSTNTGAKWTQVAHELHSAKILNDDQYVAANLYQKASARGIADVMLSASTMTGEQLWALHNTSSLEAGVAATTAFQDLARSLGNAPNGAEIVTANVRALTHLMQVRGSIKDATSLAKLMVNDEYTFSGTLRIPNSPSVDAGKIERGTESVLGDISNHKIVVPPSNSDLNENDQRLNYVQRLQSGGHWYTNEDNSGAILYDSEGGRAVMEQTTPTFNFKSATGMKSQGNLDPWNRPVLHNPDGSYSTTSSMSIGTSAGETLIPTVVGGKRLSKADAIKHYNDTGENFGSFDTPEHADAFAVKLHNAQATMFDSHGNPKGRPIELKWKDLQDIGGAHLNPGERLYRGMTGGQQ